MADENQYTYEKADLFKILDILQGSIDRMNRSSALFKGWALTLFVLTINVGIWHHNEIAEHIWSLKICITVVLFMFWCQHSFFLSYSRMFRRHYNDKVSRTDFKDLAELFKIKMDDEKFLNEKDNNLGFWKAFSSKTIKFFYLPLIILTLTFDYINEQTVDCIKICLHK